MRQTFENRYYKDRPEGVGFLISGLPLPKDADGVVRGKHFVDCEFHPNCDHVTFENCVFSRCDGPRLTGSSNERSWSWE